METKMGAVKFNVFTLTTEMASSLCRFCMKQEDSGEPHYKIDWHKWPNAEVSRLFEQVVGHKLPVSSLLSEHFCSACHWWLKDAHEKISLFKQIDMNWKTFLAVHEPQKEVECHLEQDPFLEPEDNNEEVEHEQTKEDAYAVEYLDTDMYVEEVYEEIEEDDHPTADESNIPNDESFACEEDQDADNSHLNVETMSEEIEKGCNVQILQPISNAWNTYKTSVVCDLCGERYDHKDSLLDHFSQEHNLHYHNTCETCPLMFRTREELHRHNRIHPSLSLECCDRVFNSRRHFRRHTHSVHGPFRPLTCNECHKVFLTKEKLYNHMQRHGEKKQLCTQCGRNFHLKKDLKMHIETVHQCLRKYPCDQCGRHFSTKVTMMRHSSRCGLISGQKRKVRVSAIHSPRPQMWCTECDFRCLRPDTLKRHFDKNHEGFDWELLAQCMCIKCLRQFNTVEQAVEHHAKHHPTLQCDICKTILSSELSLERHKKIHTVKDRPFTCPICLGTYVTQHQLKIHHRRKHTDERPFECPMCDKRYAERSEMNVHIRSAHNDGLRYPCTQCSNTYNSAKYLATHVAREHKGDFNFFECPTCNWRFVNARVLSEHQAVHHPILSD